MKEYIERYTTKQPAPMSYPFDGGWQVMRYVQENVFRRTGTEAQGYYKSAEGWKIQAEVEGSKIPKYWKYCVYAGFQLAGVSQYISAMLFVGLFLVLQFIILVVWAFLATIAAAFLSIITFLYGQYYKIFFRCPDCHEQMKIPVYVCPTCATEHTRLWPSVYGVLRHRCENCNTKLATMDALGRKDLVQKCVSCSTPMNQDIGRLINVHFPVIGGPSSGKSNYIFMATREFIESYALPRGFEVEFSDEKHRSEYDSNLSRFSDGNELLKTTNIIPQAYNLAVKKPRDRIGRIIYLYDAAGEAYADEENTMLQTYFKYVQGLIFVIDPFSIEMFQRENEEQIDQLRTLIRPSTLGVMPAYDRMLLMLESVKNIKGKDRFTCPISIVVTKTDALSLEEKIGQPAARALMRQNSNYRFEHEAIDHLVREFLSRYGLGNFMRDVDMRFQASRYFSCSALGRLPHKEDHSAYEPARVLQPLLWLLGQTGVASVIKEQSIMIDAEDKIYGASRGGFLSSVKYFYWESLRPKGHE